MTISAISFNKIGVQPDPLAAKWHIFKDSLTITSLPGTNYIGTSNDYYDFALNGIHYIREDSSEYFTTYSMVADDQIQSNKLLI